LGRAEAIVLTLYAALIAFAIPFHEKWSDEAQAWIIARDNSSWQIVRHVLHYEGAPALWHLILRAFYLLGGTYNGMSWLGAAFALAGIFVFLRWSPFPLALRALAPFGFFLLYQYGVIARSYNLFPLLCFALCALFFRQRRPLAFALVSALLINLCMQGMVFAAVLALLYLNELRRARRLLPEWRTLLAPAAVLAGSALVSVIVAVPAPDIGFAAAPSQSNSFVHRLVMDYVGFRRPTFEPPIIDPYNPAFPDPPYPNALRHPLVWAAWQINHRTQVDSIGHLAAQSTESSLIEGIIGILSQATWPIANSNLLACLFLAATILWLALRRALRFLLLWIALLVVGQILWVADHHAGMLLIALLCALWLAADLPLAPTPPAFVERSMLSLLGVVLLLQAGWSLVALRNDDRGAYDPGVATAQWLHSYIDQHPHARIANFNYFSESVQPFFNHSPFFNSPAFWQWCITTDPAGNHRRVVASRPDLVLIPVEFSGTGQMRNQWAPISRIFTPQQEKILPRDAIARELRDHGYRETHRFCGERFARDGFSFRDCNVFFEPDPSWVDNHPIHDETIDHLDP
jgi:hypothetical protein